MTGIGSKVGNEAAEALKPAFSFTREDVEMLTEAIDYIRVGIGFHEDRARSIARNSILAKLPDLDTLAERIEALLPPSERPNET